MAPWKDLLPLPAEVKDRIPSGYDMVGDVVVVRVPDDLKAHEPAVAAALLGSIKAARVVAVDRGVEGPFRARRLEVVAGEPRTTTEIVEHGLRLRLDMATCYFSPRLSGERERVAAMVHPGEHVLDLFAGVGPFALLCARRGALVVANDLNPDAVRFLAENTRHNRLEARVHVVHGDAALVGPALPGWAHRVIMNLPHEARAFLPAAVAASAPDAMLHVGAMVNRHEVDAYVEAFPRAAGARRLDVRHVREARGYNPAVRHYVLDVEVA